MKIFELEKSEKLTLTVDNIARLLGISRESAKVSASRYVKMNRLIRIKRDFYILKNRFKQLRENEIFYLANIIQTPSYISLSTALSYYNISTQQQRNYIECIAQKRTINIIIDKVEFVYTLVKKDLYSGFEFKDGCFIATPEKALFDAFYLTSLKKYNCDFEAIDFKKINRKKIEYYIEKNNDKTKKFWENLCKTYKI